MNLFTGVYQINLRVKDIELACQWYEKVLGFKKVKDYGKTVVLGTGEGVPLCLIEQTVDQPLPDNSEGTHPVISIDLNAVRDCRTRLEEMKVTVLDGGSRGHFKFRDLDGNLLEAYLPGLYEEEEFQIYR